MAQDYGIFITQPGTDVKSAKTNQVAMNTSNPFIKIDTQTSTGFQTILLLITNDPPEPAAGNTNYLVIYKFAHGYKYTPAVETLYNITNPGASTANAQIYFQDSGQISAHTFDDYANIYTVTDATFVYFVVSKYLGNIAPGQPNLLTGTNIQITCHVFADGVQ